MPSMVEPVSFAASSGSSVAAAEACMHLLEHLGFLQASKVKRDWLHWYVCKVMNTLQTDTTPLQHQYLVNQRDVADSLPLVV